MTDRIAPARIVVALLCLAMAACANPNGESNPAAISSSGSQLAPGSPTGIAGCKTPSAATADKDKPAKVAIATVAQNQTPNLAPLEIALGHGYFKDVEQADGVQITVDSFGTGPASLAAYLGGSDNWLLAGLTAQAVAASKSQDLVAVFQNQSGGQGVIVGRKQFEQSRGSDIKKYKGGTFGFTTAGSTSQTYLKAFVNSSGLNYDTDVKPIAVGSVAGYAPALQAGRVDVINMDSVSAAEMVTKGIGYVIANINDPKTIEPLWGTILGSGLSTSQSFIAKYPALSHDIACAMARAVQFINQHADDASAIYDAHPADFQAAIPRGTFTSAWVYIKTSYTTGAFSSQGISDSIKLWKTIGALPNDATVPAIFWNKSVLTGKK